MTRRRRRGLRCAMWAYVASITALAALFVWSGWRAFYVRFNDGQRVVEVQMLYGCLNIGGFGIRGHPHASASAGTEPEQKTNLLSTGAPRWDWWFSYWRAAVSPTNVYWNLSVPGWAVLGAFAAPLCWMAAARWRRASCTQADCPRCGYDLSGVPAGVCPECGGSRGS